MIGVREDLTTILEFITRESLNYLKAHRSTNFLMEEKSGILKTRSIYAPDPLDGQVGLFEEKEIARKAIKQERSFWLQEPKDFEEFFKYERRKRKLTSLLNTPLYSLDKPIGAFSVVLINERRSSDEKNLKCLSLFRSQASMIIENAR